MRCFCITGAQYSSPCALRALPKLTTPAPCPIIIISSQTGVGSRGDIGWKEIALSGQRKVLHDVAPQCPLRSLVHYAVPLRSESSAVDHVAFDDNRTRRVSRRNCSV